MWGSGVAQEAQDPLARGDEVWRFFRPGKRPVVSYNCLLTGTAPNGPA